MSDKRIHMIETEIIPNMDGILVVECPCNRVIAKHVHQIDRIPGCHESVMCKCGKKRHLFAHVNGGVFVHKFRDDEPIDFYDGYTG